MASTGLTSPTTTGTVSNQWTTPTGAYADDSDSAVSSTATYKQDYDGFGFSVNSSIDGIIVRCLMAANLNNRIDVDLSWDNGSSWTTAKSMGGDIAGSFTDYDFGAADDTWGHAFTKAEMANGSFLVRVTNTTGSGSIWLDHIEVNVYSTVTAYDMPAAVGAFTLTGIAAILFKGYTIVASVGSFTLTGIAALFGKTLSMVASVGSFTLTGIATGLEKGWNMVASVGSFILTGVSAIFSGAGSWKTTNQSKSSAISPTNQSKNNISPTGQSKSSDVTFLNHEKS